MGSDQWQDRARELDEQLGEVDWTSLLPGAERDVVAAPSGPLARVCLGPADGQRVVLVPGATGSKEDFLLMMPLLAAAGYRVSSFDLAGQYESAGAGPQRLTPPQSHYSMRLFTDDLLAVLDTGPGPVHLLGYSFAGTVAAAVAAAHPDRVATLTLLSAPPVPGQSFRGLKRIGPITSMANGRVGAAFMLWGIRWNLTRVDRSRLAFVRDRLRHTDRRSVDDMVGLMMHTPDLRGPLRESGIGILVAIGTSDLWPTWRHRQFADDLGAAMVSYPTGHSPCETAPHQLVRDMLELFSAAPPGEIPGGDAAGSAPDR